MSKINRFAGVYEFITAARLGSFSAAALSLGVTRSALGKSIGRLETRLGARLFHRSTRRLSLTSDGQTFLTACSGILSEFETAENAVGSGVPDVRGRLRIDLPLAFGRMHAMPVIMELLRTHPELSITASFTDRRIDIVEEGVDLALRIGLPPDTNEVVARQIGLQKLVICGSPDYFSRHSLPLAQDDIATHRCIVGRRNRASSTWLLKDYSGKHQRLPVTADYELGDGQSMLEAALMGLGLAQLPTWLAGEQLKSGLLIPVLKKVEPDPVPIVAVWPTSRHTPVRVRTVVDALHDSFLSQPVMSGE